MAIFIYHKEPISGSDKAVYGCMAFIVSSNLPDEILNTKFDLKTAPLNSDLSEVFTYFKNTKDTDIHTLLSEVQGSEKISQEVKNKTQMLEDYLLDRVLDEEKSINLPSYIKLTPQQINSTVTKYNPDASNTEKQIVFALVLLKIGRYFAENTEKVQEFPIYKAFIKQKGLNSSDFSVEDFLSSITPFEAISELLEE